MRFLDFVSTPIFFLFIDFAGMEDLILSERINKNQMSLNAMQNTLSSAGCAFCRSRENGTFSWPPFFHLCNVVGSQSVGGYSGGLGSAVHFYWV